MSVVTTSSVTTHGPRKTLLAIRPLRRFFSSKATWFGFTLITIALLLAIGGSSIAPYGADEVIGPVATRPSWKHPFGTDGLGKDVLSRVIHGFRLSLGAGMLSMGMAIAIGAPIGALAGYVGGRFDAFAMRSIDVVLAFPSVLIALLAAAAFRPSSASVVAAVALINVPTIARQLRATVLGLEKMEFVWASRALGASWFRTLWREMFPFVIGPTIVLASMGVGTAILEVAGLSFLGLGGDPTNPEWGAMLSQAKNYWSKNPFFAIAPGAAISLTVFACNLLGDGLRDAFDAKLS